MSMDIREEFEAWAKEPPLELPLLKMPADRGAWPGQYCMYETQLAAEAYQAGRRAGAEDMRERAAKVSDSAYECCGNPVVGAEYMGSVEQICCGTPLVMKEPHEITTAIRALPVEE
jgi:hypothetical protein